MPINPIRYVALGDSLTEGVGAYFSSGYVFRYRHYIERMFKRPVFPTVFAKSRITSGQVLRSLAQPEIKKAIHEASVITITAGGNDLLQAYRLYKKTNDRSYVLYALSTLQKNISLIISEIHAIKANDPYYIVRLIGFYNPYPSSPYTDYWVRMSNQMLTRFSQGPVQFIDIYPEFTLYGKSVLSFGGIHPNGKGYQIIADKLHQAGYS
ncbi:GDSL-type esterase/lipase family protein [Bacillus alkalicellulosilyticus]|uniref:GDSL-type esterase/lipase family protein n=1 Tax=Alkalihalobacterium alkalicellulosilyticum TaxID=1912214 RepID=UPI000998BE4B|nr:GDSL-type esterase/lipase family protein [Bacillus alkalicellulosilyticus]